MSGAQFEILLAILCGSLLLILLSLKLAFAESPGGSCWVDETLVENRPLLAGMLVAFGEEGLAGGVPEASGKQNMALSVLYVSMERIGRLRKPDLLASDAIVAVVDGLASA